MRPQIDAKTNFNESVSLGRVGYSAPYSAFSPHSLSCSGYRLSPIPLATLSPPRLVRGNSNIPAVLTALLALACRRRENKRRTLGRRRHRPSRPPASSTFCSATPFCVDVSTARSKDVACGLFDDNILV